MLSVKLKVVVIPREREREGRGGEGLRESEGGRAESAGITRCKIWEIKQRNKK